jgi:hypothetical protein
MTAGMNVSSFETLFSQYPLIDGFNTYFGGDLKNDEKPSNRFTVPPSDASLISCSNVIHLRRGRN